MPRERQRASGGKNREVGEAADLDEGPVDQPRERQTLLQMSLGVVKPERPQLDDAEVHQRDRPRVVAQRQLGHRVRLDGSEQRTHLAERRLEIAAPAGELQPDDRKHDREVMLPFGEDLRSMSLGQRDVCGRRLEGVLRQLDEGEERGQLGM